MIDDLTSDYDDMYAGLTDEVMKNIFIRFYSMEQYFKLNKLQNAQIKQEGNKNKQVSHKNIYLLFNKIIHECIHKLFIMNRLIYNKAKLVNSLLDNGFGISDKKNGYWSFFMEDEEFYKIKQAYMLVSEDKQKIIKYAVLSISNILLKLSINMSKISVIPLQKFLTFQRLNIPILSIIFLQFLQFRLLVVKKHSDPQQDASFLKQLPKVTVIRLGRYKNNTQTQLLLTSQFNLFTSKKKLDSPIKNLQFIDIHELDQDLIYPNYENTKSYQHILSFSLQKISGGSIKSPFTFQILFLMQTLVHPLVREFRPDIILYMQEYPLDMKIMDEQIRGLMLSQLTQETACQKIYVFKQMGFDKYSLMKKYYEKDGEIVSAQTAQLLQKIEQQQTKKMKMEPQNQCLKKAKKIMLDDLCFISLALIQKTSFDNALDASHKHIYPIPFLEGLSQKCQSLKSEIKNANQSFYRVLDQKKFALKNMKDMAKILLKKPEGEMTDENQERSSGFHIINLMNTETQFSSFYDLLHKEKQPLIANGINYRFNQQDILYVKYYADKLLAIIVKVLNDSVQMTFFSKYSSNKQLKLQKHVKLNKEANDIEGATYIASYSYLYRGFGKFRSQKNSQKLYNTAIHRLRIHPEIGNQWQIVGTKSVCLNSNGNSAGIVDLQKKVYGYGIFNGNDNFDKNLIIFLGGYIDSLSQQKISTRLYIIKKPETQKGIDKIMSLGKTNNLLFGGINQPINKLFLHPFVFGIPFQDKNLFILNGNGNYIHLNNTNKIFATELKVSSIQAYNGIVGQMKLKIPNQNEEQASKVIIMAELLGKLLVYSPNQINILKNQSCIQTLEEGLIKIWIDDKKAMYVKPQDQLFQTQEIFKLNFI